MIRVLNYEDAGPSILPLAEIITDCVNSGASVGFMAPCEWQGFIPYWNRVFSEVERGDTALLVAHGHDARTPPCPVLVGDLGLHGRPLCAPWAVGPVRIV